MNDSKNSSNGLLVLRIPQVLGKETVDLLTDHISPIADHLGLEPLVLDGGAEASLVTDYSPLLTRLCVAVEALVAQGAEPDAGSPSEAHIAPQSLNARQTGLNSRPMYHGTDFPEPSAEGTFVLQPGEKVTPRG